MSYLRFPIAAFFILSSISVSSATSVIELSQYIISYESGTFDEETLNGEVQNVVIRHKFHQDRTILIDRYKMVSSQDEDFIIIEDLSLSGVTIIDDDESKINFDELSWTDGKIEQNWIDRDEGAFSPILGAFTVTDIIASQNGKTVFTIDNILSNSTEMPNNPYQNLPLVNGNIEFRNIFIPFNENIDDKFIHNIKRAGLDGLRMSAALSAQWSFVEDRVNANMTIFMSVEKMADVRISFGLGISDAALSKINQMAETRDVGDIIDSDMSWIITEAFFNNMDLIISDKGVVDVMLSDYAAENNVSRDQAISIIMHTIATSIGGVIPNTFNEIAPHLRGFLSDGGTLYARLNPDRAIPATNILGLALLPDQAKNFLGFSINHKP